MAEWITLCLLSFAVSLDSFTAGFTFGLRKVRIPMKSLLYIGLVTAIVFSFAMFIGKQVVGLFSPAIADIIGGILFIGIGLWVIYQFFRDQSDVKPNEKSFLFKWEIKSLGVVIQILKDPNRADIDSSGDIKGFEAFVLGTALSLDAFGAGIGAAIFGFSALFTASCIAVMSSLFLFIGTKSGYFLSKWNWVEKFAFLPGIILILLGFLKLS
ncbi:putative sporulation protein YtaF [Salinibacillus kushneri]|uniref:Putative sporulation protein YtaF n=1 Tax=Salinibacillus kushneri TaxID=237682 RepID=A0A1I0H5V0_9BACI|nr:sporulation membrane protein YtaF [Salinibacillus kushneri]SET79007.1 putative sporulation protein YtaF [Salinibacillus kushneri]